MAITIVDADKRTLVTEKDVDADYLGMFVLVDRTGVDEAHTGGYIVAYGDLTDAVNKELFAYSQTLAPKIRPCILSGLEERGGSIWISRDLQ